MVSDCEQVARSLQFGALWKKNMNPRCDNLTLMNKKEHIITFGILSWLVLFSCLDRLLFAQYDQ